MTSWQARPLCGADKRDGCTALGKLGNIIAADDEVVAVLTGLGLKWLPVT